jgi:hypothetical protein
MNALDQLFGGESEDKYTGGNDYDYDDVDQDGGADDMFLGGVPLREGYDSYGVYDSDTKKTSGRYISKTPSSAAKKAARRLFKEKRGSRNITFMIRKTTRGSKREIYQYSAELEVLRTPIVINKDGNKIVIKNKINVTRVDLPDEEVAMMNMKKDMVKEKMMKKKEAEKAKLAKAKEAEKAKLAKAKEAEKAKKAKEVEKAKKAKEAERAKKAKEAEKAKKAKEAEKAKRAKKTKAPKKTKKMMGGGSCSSCNFYV